MAEAEKLRARIMRNASTNEPWVIEDMSKPLGETAVAVHYRRPLRIDEINRMPPTNDGRPNAAEPRLRSTRWNPSAGTARAS